MQDHRVFQRFAATRYMGQEHVVKVSLPGRMWGSEAPPEAELTTWNLMNS
jgi:hypothetical protein